MTSQAASTVRIGTAELSVYRGPNLSIQAVEFLQEFESILARNDVSLTSPEALQWFVLCLRQEAAAWWVTSVQQSHAAQLTQWKASLGDIISQVARSSSASSSVVSVKSTSESMQLQVKSLIDKISSSPLESYSAAKILFIAQYVSPYDHTIIQSLSVPVSLHEGLQRDQQFQSLDRSSSITSALVTLPSKCDAFISSVSTNTVALAVNHNVTESSVIMRTSGTVTATPETESPDGVMKTEESAQVKSHWSRIPSTIQESDHIPLDTMPNEGGPIQFGNTDNTTISPPIDGIILVDRVRRLHDRGKPSATTAFIAEFEDREPSRQRPGPIPQHNNGVPVRRSSRNIVC